MHVNLSLPFLASDITHSVFFEFCSVGNLNSFSYTFNQFCYQRIVEHEHLKNIILVRRLQLAAAIYSPENVAFKELECLIRCVSVCHVDLRRPALSFISSMNLCARTKNLELFHIVASLTFKFNTQTHTVRERPRHRVKAKKITNIKIR